MSVRLYVFPPSPRNFKVLLVAHQLGVDATLQVVDLTRGEQSAAEFAALNPNKKTPALEDGDLKLWESNAIICHLASLKPEAGLMPCDDKARADVLRWLFWESTTWDPPCAMLAFERVVKAILLKQAPDPAEEEKGETRLRAAAAVLDAHLKTRDFVCGRLSLADFALASPLILSERAQLPLDDFAAIRDWSARVAALPAWRAAQAQAAA